MKNMLAVTALGEGATGLVLLVNPAVVVRLLFGAGITDAGVAMSRIAGIALVGLGVACWPNGSHYQPLYGMLTYSTLAMLYLLYFGIRGAVRSESFCGPQS